MLLNKQDSMVLLVDVQEKLTPAIVNKDQLIAGCEWILKLAKKLDVPILASEQYPKGLGHTLAPLANYFAPEHCVEKIHFSCLQEQAYTHQINTFLKNQMILIGIEAHVCVLQTAMDLKQAGYTVFVVVDAVSSRNEQDLKYGLKRMKHEGIHLVTREMVFFEWLRQAGTPQFKALSQEFLQA